MGTDGVAVLRSTATLLRSVASRTIYSPAMLRRYGKRGT